MIAAGDALRKAIERDSKASVNPTVQRSFDSRPAAPILRRVRVHHYCGCVLTSGSRSGGLPGGRMPKRKAPDGESGA